MTERRLIFSAVLLLAGSAFASQALAQDCGAPPQDRPVLPDGDKASSDELRDARAAVRTFSDAVDEWIACKDTRAKKVFTWMTDEQMARWNEDIDKVHEDRVALQRSMNDQIRAFNARTQGDNS